jgi:hypothetical protein
MTYYSKLKIPVLSLLLSFLLMLSFDCLAVPKACTIVAGEIVPTLNTADNNYDCFTAPTEQRVLFYKIAFCKATTVAVPANATVNQVTSIDRSSCSTLWQNTAGAEVSVNFGVTNTFPGTISMPPVGTYNSIYIEIDPTFAYAWSGTIATAATTSGINGGGDTTGTTCFTNGGEKMNNQDVGAGKANNITCNSGPAAPVPSIINNNVLGMIGNPPTSDITSMVGVVPSFGTQTYSAALINQATGVVRTPGSPIVSRNQLVTSPSPRSPTPGTTVIGAWMTMTNKITPTTSSFVLKMSNTQGINIQFGDDGKVPAVWNNRINGAVNGSFDFNLTVQ